MNIQYKQKREFAYKCGEHYHLYEQGYVERKAVVPVIYCCEEMKAFAPHIDGLLHKKEGYGYIHSDDGGDYGESEYEEYPFKFCPFCAEPITMECIESVEVRPIYEKRTVTETVYKEEKITKEKNLIVGLTIKELEK